MLNTVISLKFVKETVVIQSADVQKDNGIS